MADEANLTINTVVIERDELIEIIRKVVREEIDRKMVVSVEDIKKVQKAVLTHSGR